MLNEDKDDSVIKDQKYIESGKLKVKSKDIDNLLNDLNKDC